MKPTLHLPRPLRVFTVTSACLWVCSTFAIGEPPLVQFGPTEGSLALVNTGLAAVVQVDEHDWPGVVRAANDLRT
ncbi:MAG: hypothetical protein ACREIC_17105, partial [Limisphaerales bacterium]